MTTTADARAEFIRALDGIERENREPSAAEDRLLKLAFEHMLDCHFPPAVTTLRGVLLDVKRNHQGGPKAGLVSVDEWRRKLTHVY